MKKIFYIIIFFVLIAGCSKDDKINPVESIDFHKGTEGLSMEIVKDLPPEDIWKNSEFTIGIRLQNKGPSDIKSGEIVLSGLDPKYSELEEYQQSFRLSGRSYEYPEGDQEIIKFNVKNIGVPIGSNEYTAAFTARAYYDYETEASANVCINPDIYSYGKVDDVCENKEIALSGGQGAPVAVTKIQERISPLSESYGSIEVEFKIELENLGAGEVVKKVVVDDVLLVNKRLSCNLQEIEVKKGKKSSIICETNLDGIENAYTSSLIIRLSYEYTQKIDKSLKVLSLVTNERKSAI